jgi:hypothetical protein
MKQLPEAANGPYYSHYFCSDQFSAIKNPSKASKPQEMFLSATMNFD